ncbi:hypothetical protein L083_2023 [Actinoplanes sp. N902-109]|nr:hypothetical protein L083_2023 [Actinoplanes sp. N902-109]
MRRCHRAQPSLPGFPDAEGPSGSGQEPPSASALCKGGRGNPHPLLEA